MGCARPAVDVAGQIGRKPLAVLLRYVYQKIGWLILALIALVGGQAATLVVPQMLGAVVDAINKALEGGDKDKKHWHAIQS